MYRRIAAVLFAVLLCVRAGASIGKLTEVTGPTQIVRGEKKIVGEVGTELEAEDTIETLKARVSITFEDDTRMQVTEFSKLKIDEFVYDASSEKGRLSMKTAFGTVRYASGLIAKNTRENVRVETPTAKISVRGTDFSMTVSEDGKSLVVLLPSLPNSSGLPSIVGIIEVSNAGGSVIMDKAYQATLVTSLQSSPSIPVILEFQDESKINNMIMVETPKVVTQAAKETKKNAGNQSGASDDGGDSKSNKKAAKADTATAVAQVEATAAPVQAAVEEATVESSPVLNLSALQPQTLEAVKETILALPPLTYTTPIQSGSPFASDGVNAVLNVTTSRGHIHYKLKGDTSATFSITDGNGTTFYQLNFGDKVKINIIQK